MVTMLTHTDQLLVSPPYYGCQSQGVLVPSFYGNSYTSYFFPPYSVPIKGVLVLSFYGNYVIHQLLLSSIQRANQRSACSFILCKSYTSYFFPPYSVPIKGVLVPSFYVSHTPATSFLHTACQSKECLFLHSM